MARGFVGRARELEHVLSIVGRVLAGGPPIYVVGVTGPRGIGKSSFLGRVMEVLSSHPDCRVVEAKRVYETLQAKRSMAPGLGKVLGGVAEALEPLFSLLEFLGLASTPLTGGMTIVPKLIYAGVSLVARGPRGPLGPVLEDSAYYTIYRRLKRMVKGVKEPLIAAVVDDVDTLPDSVKPIPLYLLPLAVLATGKKLVLLASMRSEDREFVDWFRRYAEGLGDALVELARWFGEKPLKAGGGRLVSYELITLSGLDLEECVELARSLDRTGLGEARLRELCREVRGHPLLVIAAVEGGLRAGDVESLAAASINAGGVGVRRLLLLLALMGRARRELVDKLSRLLGAGYGGLEAQAGMWLLAHDSHHVWLSHPSLAETLVKRYLGELGMLPYEAYREVLQELWARRDYPAIMLLSLGYGDPTVWYEAVRRQVEEMEEAGYPTTAIVEHLERSLRMYERTYATPSREYLMALLDYAEWLLALGHHEKALEAAEKAERMAVEKGEDSVRARALVVRAHTMARMGRYGEALELVHGALRLNPTGETIAKAYYVEALCLHSMKGMDEETYRAYMRVVEAVEGYGLDYEYTGIAGHRVPIPLADQASKAIHNRFLLWLYIRAGLQVLHLLEDLDPGEARKAYERLLAELEKAARQHPSNKTIRLAHLSAMHRFTRLLRRLGNLEEALAKAEELLRQAEEEGLQTLRIHVLENMAETLREMGRSSECAEKAREAAELAEGIGYRIEYWRSRCIEVLCLAETGSPQALARARSILEEVEKHWSEVKAHSRIRELCSKAIQHLTLGK